MVKLLPMTDFQISVGRSMHIRMELAPFYGASYECACGQEHILEPYSQILYQGFWRIVIVCPDDERYLTCVKIKMILMVKFTGLQSISGTRIKTDTDKLLLANLLAQLK